MILLCALHQNKGINTSVGTSDHIVSNCPIWINQIGMNSKTSEKLRRIHSDVSFSAARTKGDFLLEKNTESSSFSENLTTTWLLPEVRLGGKSSRIDFVHFTWKRPLRKGDESVSLLLFIYLFSPSIQHNITLHKQICKVFIKHI